MSARRIDKSSLLGLMSRTSHCIALSAGTVQIRKNGIEFQSEQPFVLWTEMTVSIQAAGQAKTSEFTGVVVACDGSQPTGYQVTMAFLNMPPQSQARLGTLATS
jgi:hypothetical protein